MSKEKILEEISIERSKQDDKWGEQNHPHVDPVLLDRGIKRMSEEYEVPTAERAKFLCQSAEDKGELTWMHILVEELCEALEAGMVSPVKLREELIQLGACVVAEIECIDKQQHRAVTGRIQTQKENLSAKPQSRDWEPQDYTMS